MLRFRSAAFATLWVSLSAATPGVLTAQAMADADPRTPRFLLAVAGTRKPIDVQRTPALSRHIALDFNGETLAEALAVITRRSGLRPAYAEDVLPRDARVQLRARPGGSEPRAPALPAPDRRRPRRLALLDPPEAPGLGRRQAPGLSRAPASWCRVAGRQHRQRPARAAGAARKAAPASPPPTPGGGGAHHHRAQRSLDRRLQGAVHDSRRDLLLSADDPDQHTRYC